MGNVIRDFKQDRNGNKQFTAIAVDVACNFNNASGSRCLVVARDSIQFEQPRRIEDDQIAQDSDSSHSRVISARFSVNSGVRCFSSRPVVTKSPRPPRKASVPAISRSPSEVTRDA